MFILEVEPVKKLVSRTVSLHKFEAEEKMSDRLTQAFPVLQPKMVPQSQVRPSSSLLQRQ